MIQPWGAVFWLRPEHRPHSGSFVVSVGVEF